jgi:hypothetical protein
LWQVLSLSDYEDDNLIAGMFPDIADAEGNYKRGDDDDDDSSYGSDSSGRSRSRSNSPVRGRGRSPEANRPAHAPPPPAVKAAVAGVKGEKLTPAERLKRKMAMALNKTSEECLVAPFA